MANGGSEFLVSSTPYAYDNHLSLWAITNTASLQGANPSMLLTQAFVTTLEYYLPQSGVPQKTGPLTLGVGMAEEYLDAGYFSDSRVLSTMYSGGRLFVTLASAVLDANNNAAAGGLYSVFSPTLRNGVLSAASPVKQGYLAATNNQILRPSIAVNPQGKGAITFTLVGNDYFPSSAFVSIDLTAATPSAIQMWLLARPLRTAFPGTALCRPAPLVAATE